MKIKTKFNIGELVWVIHNNKLVHDKIVRVEIEMEANRINIYYSVKGVDKHLPNGVVKRVLSENILFKTKEDLLNSL